MALGMSPVYLRYWYKSTNTDAEHAASADIDIVLARCRNADGGDWMPCWDMEACLGSSTLGSSLSWHSKTCEVSFRHHFTGAHTLNAAYAGCRMLTYADVCWRTLT